MKRCPRCGLRKPLEEFPRDRSAKTGYGSRCKPCHNAQSREVALRKYGGYRHYRLKSRHGIGAEEVQQMIDAQGGLCLICLERPAAQVDHDHATGRIRGILCLKWNAGLGAFKDNVETIYRAIDYLDKGGFVDDATVP